MLVLVPSVKSLTMSMIKLLRKVNKVLKEKHNSNTPVVLEQLNSMPKCNDNCQKNTNIVIQSGSLVTYCWFTQRSN